MCKKPVWLCLLTAVVVVLSTSLATAAPTTGERALSAKELGSTIGTCCFSDYDDWNVCVNEPPQVTSYCITGMSTCEVIREYSGHPVRKCIEGKEGTCRFSMEVECYRDVVFTTTIVTLSDCVWYMGIQFCSFAENTCTECTVATVGPWILENSYFCDKEE